MAFGQPPAWIVYSPLLPLFLLLALAIASALLYWLFERESRRLL